MLHVSVHGIWVLQFRLYLWAIKCHGGPNLFDFCLGQALTFFYWNPADLGPVYVCVYVFGGFAKGFKEQVTITQSLSYMKELYIRLNKISKFYQQLFAYLKVKHRRLRHILYAAIWKGFHRPSCLSVRSSSSGYALPDNSHSRMHDVALWCITDPYHVEMSLSDLKASNTTIYVRDKLHGTSTLIWQ